MRSVLKKILIVVAVLVGIFLVWWAIEVGYSVWGNYKSQKQNAAFMDKLEQPYKEDVHGGKTPEETWGMFLDALKKGDIDLASKYYDVGHQEKAKETILKIKNDGGLVVWIKELETLEKNNNSSTTDYLYYSYKYFNPEFRKDLWSQVVFYYNPSTKVWKIVY